MRFDKVPQSVLYALPSLARFFFRCPAWYAGFSFVCCVMRKCCVDVYCPACYAVTLFFASKSNLDIGSAACFVNSPACYAGIFFISYACAVLVSGLAQRTGLSVISGKNSEIYLKFQQKFAYIKKISYLCTRNGCIAQRVRINVLIRYPFKRILSTPACHEQEG